MEGKTYRKIIIVLSTLCVWLFFVASVHARDSAVYFNQLNNAHLNEDGILLGVEPVLLALMLCMVIVPLYTCIEIAILRIIEKFNERNALLKEFEQWKKERFYDQNLPK